MRSRTQVDGLILLVELLKNELPSSTSLYYLDRINRYTLLYFAGLLTLLLPAYVILYEGSSIASPESVGRLDPRLDGLDYRIRRLPLQTSQDGHFEEVIGALRDSLRELRSEFEELVATRSPGPDLDLAAVNLRNRVDDLTIRYTETIFGRLESKYRFMEAIESRFDDLDRELAVLEGSIYEWEFRDRFDESIATLYVLRDRVLLQIGEAAASSDSEFSTMKIELASLIGTFDIMIARATTEVDHAYDTRHPVRSLKRMWL